jgi:hypothetical protein
MDSINTALLEVFEVPMMVTADSKRSSPTMTNTWKASSGLTLREPVFGLSITPNNADKAFFWPSEGDEEGQLRLFAERVVPKVRTSLIEKTIKAQVT